MAWCSSRQWEGRDEERYTRTRGDGCADYHRPEPLAHTGAVLSDTKSVAQRLRNNLAQGVMNERGSFEVKLTPSHNTSRDESGKLEVNHVDNRDAANHRAP